MNEVLAAHASIDLGWFAWVVILTVLLGMLALFDVRVSTRMQLVVGVASVAAILLLLVIVLAKYVELAEPDATPARGAS